MSSPAPYRLLLALATHLRDWFASLPRTTPWIPPEADPRHPCDQGKPLAPDGPVCGQRPVRRLFLRGKVLQLR